jgi:hypothetical protein
MLYIIPVAFKDFLPSLVYHHFLYFHVAMKLLVNPQLCKQYAKYANQLLIKFIRDSIKIYGKKFVVYNVHNLVHLPEDVLEFGCVDNFSAFPFENFLQKLKHMLKHCGKPLEQVVRRYHELKKILTFSNKETNKKKIILIKVHENGPLSQSFISKKREIKQYQKLNHENWSVSCDNKNCCVMLNDKSVILILNIIQNEKKEIFLIGKKYLKQGNLFETPLQSSALDELVVSDLDSNLSSWPLTDVLFKMLRIPTSLATTTEFFVAPIIYPSINTK